MIQSSLTGSTHKQPQPMPKANPKGKQAMLNKALNSKAVKQAQTQPIKPKEISSIKDQPKVDEYLKLISQLEGKAKEGKVEKEAVQNLMAKLAERVGELDVTKRKRMLKLEFFKTHGLKNLGQLEETLLEAFNKKEDQQEVFDFLKSRDFINLLMGQESKPETYDPASIKAASKNRLASSS